MTKTKMSTKRTATKKENRLTERVKQINREMRDLCAEIDSLQERALPRVEEMGESFLNGEGLEELDEYGVLNIKENFTRLQRLITKV